MKATRLFFLLLITAALLGVAVAATTRAESVYLPLVMNQQASISTQPDDATTPGQDGECAADNFLNVTADPSNSDLPAPSLTVTCDNGQVIINSNSIPNHATGDFPNSGNPNTISAQNDNFAIPAQPVQNGSATYLNRATFGVAINGIEFDPMTAEYWNNDRNSGWNYDALGGILLGLDYNNAHVQPTGAYHYHGLPNGLIDQLASDNSMTLVGYAADGFPVYALNGYRDANDPNSGLVEMEASWQLKSGTRADGPGGVYDGTFVQDWQYAAGLGDLDECNGRYGVTPEYPDGTYHYYLTDEYPYIPRCHMGTPDASFTLGGPGAAGPGGLASANSTQRGPASVGNGPSTGNTAGVVPATNSVNGAPAATDGQTGRPPRPDFASAAATLGVTEAQLMDALGGPPPNFESAATALGISVDELMTALGAPAGPGGGQAGPPRTGRGPAGG